MFSYWGEAAAIGTAVCWSFTAIFFSYSGRRIGSNVVSRSRLLFALPFICLAHLAIQKTIFPLQTEPFRWGWLGLSSILGLVLGDTFLFYAYVWVGPRLSLLVMSFVPVITSLAGRLLFQEQLSGLEMVGIGFTVLGVIVVVTENGSGRDNSQKQQYLLGLLAAFGGAIGQATNLITAHYGLVDNFPTISATAIRLLVAILILWSFTALRGQLRETFQKWQDRKALLTLIAGSIFGPFLGIWLSMAAIQQTRVGIASTLMALPPIILLPLSYFIYGEQITGRAIFGTLIAFAGVACIFL